MPENIDDLQHYDFARDFDEENEFHVAEAQDDERMIDMMHLEDLFG